MIATSYQHIPFIILHDHMELDKSFLKKYKYLRSNEMGINSILASNADKALKEVLNVLDPSYHNIFVSRNFRFGKKRSGDINTLKKFEEKFSYKTIITIPYQKNKKIVLNVNNFM